MKTCLIWPHKSKQLTKTTRIAAICISPRHQLSSNLQTCPLFKSINAKAPNKKALEQAQQIVQIRVNSGLTSSTSTSRYRIRHKIRALVVLVRTLAVSSGRRPSKRNRLPGSTLSKFECRLKPILCQRKPSQLRYGR